MRLDINTEGSHSLLTVLNSIYGISVPVSALKSAIQDHIWSCISADRAEIWFDPETNEIVSKQTRKGRTLVYRSSFRGSLTGSTPCEWGPPVLYL